MLVKDHTSIKTEWGADIEHTSHVDGIQVELFNQSGTKCEIIIPHDKFRPWSEQRGFVNDMRAYHEYAQEVPDKHIYMFLDDHPNFFIHNANFNE